MKFILLTRVTLVSVTLLAAGCQPSLPSQSRTTEFEEDAQALLDKVREVYRTQRAYSDDGVLLLSYNLNGAAQLEKHPFSVAFEERENHDIRLFHGRFNGRDGRQVIAIFDPQTNNVDNQVLVRDRISFRQALDLPADPILRHFCDGAADLPLSNRPGTRAWFIPLPYLLASDIDRQPWFEGSLQLLDPSFIKGQRCQRMRVKTEAGNTVLWIDAETYLVRRVEYPNSLLNERLLKESQIGPCKLTAEFRNASWRVSDDKGRLSWKPVRGARRVRHFVSLPAPFPSELIGDVAPPFETLSIDGRRVQRGGDGKSVSAWLWTSTDPICREPLAQFDRVAESMKTDVRFYNVSTDLVSRVSNTQLKALMGQWKINSVTTVRDWKESGRQHFDIKLLPTLVVLDSAGVIQYFKVIDDGQVEAALQAVLSRVLRGDDVAQEMRSEYASYLEQYRQQLADASWSKGQSSTAIRPTTAPIRRLPTQYQLTPLWVNRELVAPGNVAVWDQRGEVAHSSASGNCIAVLDGYQTLMLLNDKGQVQRRITLGEGPKDIFNHIKPLRNGRLAGWGVSSVLGTRLKYVDGNGVVEEILDAEAGLIRDFLVVKDGQEAGPLFYVGFWDGKGLQRYTRTGGLEAQIGEIPNINGLALTPNSQTGSSKILGVGREGGLFRTDFEMSGAVPAAVRGMKVDQVYSADAASSDGAMICVVGLTDGGKSVARGLSENWDVCWEIPISEETNDEHVQWVKSGRLDEGTIWAMARPGGDIHLISGSGARKDIFATGMEIRGMAIRSQGGVTQLLVATEEGVHAWRIEAVLKQARLESATSTGTLE